MSKRIGIFGDSFSDDTWNDNSYKAWTELLSEDYSIENYSRNGSSLWYSYDKFLNNHKKYDLCIFVATVFGRFYLEHFDHHLNINRNTWLVKDNVNLGKAYYEHFFSLNREKTFHNFMLKDILSRSNVIFIPAFEECMVDPTCISLNHFSNAELHHYGVLNYTGPDDRKCHMSIENNLVIYHKIKSAIVEGVNCLKLSMDDFVAPTEPFNFYFNRDYNDHSIR